MLLRSIVAIVLSMPATVAIVGAFIVITPASSAISMAALLLAFPVWVCIASASYLTPRPGVSALVLVAVSACGFGLIASLKATGIAGL